MNIRLKAFLAALHAVPVQTKPQTMTIRPRLFAIGRLMAGLVLFAPAVLGSSSPVEIDLPLTAETCNGMLFAVENSIDKIGDYTQEEAMAASTAMVYMAIHVLKEANTQQPDWERIKRQLNILRNYIIYIPPKARHDKIEVSNFQLTGTYLFFAAKEMERKHSAYRISGHCFDVACLALQKSADWGNNSAAKLLETIKS